MTKSETINSDVELELHMTLKSAKKLDAQDGAQMLMNGMAELASRSQTFSDCFQSALLLHHVDLRARAVKNTAGFLAMMMGAIYRKQATAKELVLYRKNEKLLASLLNDFDFKDSKWIVIDKLGDYTCQRLSWDTAYKFWKFAEQDYRANVTK